MNRAEITALRARVLAWPDRRADLRRGDHRSAAWRFALVFCCADVAIWAINYPLPGLPQIFWASAGLDSKQESLHRVLLDLDADSILEILFGNLRSVLSKAVGGGGLPLFDSRPETMERWQTLLAAFPEPRKAEVRAAIQSYLFAVETLRQSRTHVGGPALGLASAGMLILEELLS